MIPWEHIDTAPVPGGGCLTLHCRDAEYSIRIDGQELMNSRLHSSEEELAQRVCSQIAGRPRPRVLIGGLGMGYTLGAALASLGKSAEVVVAEIAPAVVNWNRKELSHLAGDPLADPRTIVHEGDVVPLLCDPQAAEGRYDGVMLDVDNGPEAMTRERNERLYNEAGLANIRRALTDQGVVGIWSAGPDRNFSARLAQSGLEFEEVQVPARRGERGGRKKRSGRYTLWIGTRPPD